MKQQIIQILLGLWNSVGYYGSMQRVVIGTNVLVSAVRSRKGASFRLLSLVGTDLFEIAASVPLVLEYEDALIRQLEATSLESSDIIAIVDYLCSLAVHQNIFFLWRPLLPDPQDDHVAEVAIAGGCEMIVTFNKRDFQPIKQFGISLATPFEFLQQLGEIP